MKYKELDRVYNPKTSSNYQILKIEEHTMTLKKLELINTRLRRSDSENHAIIYSRLAIEKYFTPTNKAFLEKM
jgi:hypothetical protein